MKKILLVYILIISIAKLNAQNFKLIETGIKGGINTSFRANLPATASQKLRVGYTAGTYARFKLFGFFLQPEFLVYRGGFNIYYYSQFTPYTMAPANISEDISSTNIQIPLLIGKKLNLRKFGLNLSGGIAFTYLLQGTTKRVITPITPLPPLPLSFTETEKYTQEDLFPVIFLQTGIGLDISRINLDFRYQQQFRQGLNGIGLQFTVGYKLFQRRTEPK